MTVYEGCHVESSNEQSDGAIDVDINGYLLSSTDEPCLDGGSGAC